MGAFFIYAPASSLLQATKDLFSSCCKRKQDTNTAEFAEPSNKNYLRATSRPTSSEVDQLWDLSKAAPAAMFSGGPQVASSKQQSDKGAPGKIVAGSVPLTSKSALTPPHV